MSKVDATATYLQIQQIDAETLFKRMDGLIESRLTSVISTLPKPTPPDEYLTREEVAQMLKITLPTLHDWSKRGILKAYRIGTKVRFLRSEVESSPKYIEPVRVAGKGGMLL